MKIAIPTSDKKTVFSKTGKTKEFAICEIIEGSYEFVEFRNNPFQADGDSHTEEHMHKALLELLNDCDALLVQATGELLRAELWDANMPIYKTNENDLKEAITLFTLNMVGHKRI